MMSKRNGLGLAPLVLIPKFKSIEIRKELTDEWKNRLLKEGQQFATLTDIITKTWAGKTTKEYKVLKGFKKESLREYDQYQTYFEYACRGIN